MNRFRIFLALIATFAASSAVAFAQTDKNHVSDTARINEILRSGSVFGPTQFNYISWQDNMMGASPEAAKMTKYADAPLSYAYGQAEIGIPVYTVHGRQLSLPITLNYDSKGNVIQHIQTDAGGKSIRTSRSYGFTGNLLGECQRVCPGTGLSDHTLEKTFTYDGRLRPTGVSSTLDGGAQASLTYTYDDLQRLSTVNYGTGTELIQMGYTLQGWLQSVASASWEETLRYQSPSRMITDSLPGKAGLITEWTARQKGSQSDGETVEETYAYAYDKAGRLLGSVRFEGASTSGESILTERNITYDASGNLLTLDRYDDCGGVTPSQSFTFTYSGPKRIGWGYDAHGNVTGDPVSGTTLSWNAIGLPDAITDGTNTIQRTYLSDGSLEQVSNGASSRLHLGDLVFVQSGNTLSLESAAWEGGRILPGSGADKVLYYVNDHLGSIRVVKDGTGAIRQRFDYYPYGTVSRVWSSVTAETPEKHYRFGGKEIVGTGYLDFGARLYNPGTAMWMSQDPMAEDYYPIGPLVYCTGNPVNIVDPEGMQWYSYIDHEGKMVFKYWEGEMPKEEQEKFDNIQLVGYVYHDDANNKYYSLFGEILDWVDSQGRPSHGQVYSLIDKLIINHATRKIDFDTGDIVKVRMHIDGLPLGKNRNIVYKSRRYGFDTIRSSSTDISDGNMFWNVPYDNSSATISNLPNPNSTKSNHNFLRSNESYWLTADNPKKGARAGFRIIQLKFDQKGSIAFKQAYFKLFKVQY